MMILLFGNFAYLFLQLILRKEPEKNFNRENLFNNYTAHVSVKKINKSDEDFLLINTSFI